MMPLLYFTFLLHSIFSVGRGQSKILGHMVVDFFFIRLALYVCIWEHALAWRWSLDWVCHRSGLLGSIQVGHMMEEELQEW